MELHTLNQHFYHQIWRLWNGQKAKGSKPCAYLPHTATHSYTPAHIHIIIYAQYYHYRIEFMQLRCAFPTLQSNPTLEKHPILNATLPDRPQRRARTQSLVTVSEDTAGNPDGAILENVPATIVAPVPGPPDFNGASAVVARLPNIGFAPSMLTEKGFETRGSFTVRKSRAGESFYLRVYGKLNHNIRCTLRGYRDLSGDFTGNTIYTGKHSCACINSDVSTRTCFVFAFRRPEQ
jgi:hypothetical protein